MSDDDEEYIVRFRPSKNISPLLKDEFSFITAKCGLYYLQKSVDHHCLIYRDDGYYGAGCWAKTGMEVLKHCESKTNKRSIEFRNAVLKHMESDNER
jgi:hypothetical protein